MTKGFIIALGFILFSLIGFVEMTATGFLSCQGIQDHEFTDLKETSHSAGSLKTLVEI